MTTNEVTRCMSSLERSDYIVIVDAVPVISVYEESSLDTRIVESIDYLTLIDVRAIIEGEGNRVRSCARAVDSGKALTSDELEFRLCYRRGYWFRLGGSEHYADTSKCEENFTKHDEGIVRW